jgi:DNA end-binding protein Ku
MAQAVWTGAISFGLVSIPVKLYPATEPKDVRFHLYDRRTGKRIHYERVTRDDELAAFEPEPAETGDWDDAREEAAPPTGEDIRFAKGEHGLNDPIASSPIAREDVVRGLDLPTGDLVTVTDEELYSIAPERSRTIDIEEFVDLAEIDPVFFEKSYHVAPARGTGADKPYVLLLRAMQAAGMVGIGRFVLRTKPHLVAIRPLADALALETLFFGDEIRAARDLVGGLAAIAVSDTELRMAKQLIGAMATTWVPERHADVYREELLQLLGSKAPERPAEEVETGVAAVGDLMTALRASVEAAKRSGKAKPSRSTKAG